MNSSGRPEGSQMNGRRIQQIWLPRNRLHASQVNKTFAATKTLPPLQRRSKGNRRALPMMPASAMKAVSVSCMKPYSGEDCPVLDASDGVFQTTNNEMGLSAPRMSDVIAKLTNTMVSG